MEVILEKKETLAKLADEVQIYPQVLKNVRVKIKRRRRQTATCRRRFRRYRMRWAIPVES